MRCPGSRRCPGARPRASEWRITTSKAKRIACTSTCDRAPISSRTSVTRRASLARAVSSTISRTLSASDISCIADLHRAGHAGVEAVDQHPGALLQRRGVGRRAPPAMRPPGRRAGGSSIRWARRCDRARPARHAAAPGAAAARERSRPSRGRRRRRATARRRAGRPSPGAPPVRLPARAAGPPRGLPGGRCRPAAQPPAGPARGGPAPRSRRRRHASAAAVRNRGRPSRAGRVRSTTPRPGGRAAARRRRWVSRGPSGAWRPSVPRRCRRRPPSPTRLQVWLVRASQSAAGRPNRASARRSSAWPSRAARAAARASADGVSPMACGHCSSSRKAVSRRASAATAWCHSARCSRSARRPSAAPSASVQAADCDAEHSVNSLGTSAAMSSGLRPCNRRPATSGRVDVISQRATTPCGHAQAHLQAAFRAHL
jgi:hypothetical protein